MRDSSLDREIPPPGTPLDTVLEVQTEEAAPPAKRINTCHSFSWSRKLWKDASRKTAKIAFILFVCYGVAGYYLLAHRDGMRGVDPFYFLATTLTTGRMAFS